LPSAYHRALGKENTFFEKSLPSTFCMALGKEKKILKKSYPVLFLAKHILRWRNMPKLPSSGCPALGWLAADGGGVPRWRRSLNAGNGAKRAEAPARSSGQPQISHSQLQGAGSAMHGRPSHEADAA